MPVCTLMCTNQRVCVCVCVCVVGEGGGDPKCNSEHCFSLPAGTQNYVICVCHID